MNTDNHTTPEMPANNRPHSYPEWVTVPEASRIVSIGVTKLYELINEQKIRSVCLRKKGCIRGMRRIHTASLLEFMDSLESE